MPRSGVAQELLRGDEDGEVDDARTRGPVRLK